MDEVRRKWPRQMKKENVSLLACLVQTSIDPPLNRAGVYYLGDYFQSFSFWPCACGSSRQYEDWLSALQPQIWPECSVDIGLNQPQPLILTYSHLSDLNRLLLLSHSPKLLLPHLHLLTLPLPFSLLVFHFFSIWTLFSLKQIPTSRDKFVFLIKWLSVEVKGSQIPARQE